MLIVDENISFHGIEHLDLINNIQLLHFTAVWNIFPVWKADGHDRAKVVSVDLPGDSVCFCFFVLIIFFGLDLPHLSWSPSSSSSRTMTTPWWAWHCFKRWWTSSRPRWKWCFKKNLDFDGSHFRRGKTSSLSETSLTMRRLWNQV